MTKNPFRLFFFILICFLYLSLTVRAFSQTPTPDQSSQNALNEISAKIAKLEGQLAETQKQEKSLSQQIGFMNNQIQLTLLQIEDTQAKLTALGNDIEKLLTKIKRLESSLDDIAAILLNRVKETYMKGQINSFDLILGNSGFTSLLNRFKYLKVAQAHDKKLMIQIQNTKVNYQEQKTLLEEKKKEQEALKKQLQGYKYTLDSQKKDKEQLLSVTQNDERNYQQMLANLNRQKQSLLSAVANSGIAPEGFHVWSGDDNYFNQADSRWANNAIGGSSSGGSPSYMWEYGCAVTSTSMVLSHMGIDIDPGRLSGNSIYYFDLIAWQKVPEVFSVSLVGDPYGAVNWGTIDQNLSEGKWVIVHVWMFTRNGHYIVLKSREGDDYKIHDPYFGPNLMLTSRYSKGVVDQMIIYQKR